LPLQDAPDLERAFFAGDRLDTEIVVFIRTLRPRYRTAIISNAADNLTRFITDDFPMIDAFDLVVGSAYEKVMKPNPAIYRAALERLGVAPQEAVFIDDFAQNIVGAEAVGMHGIHFTPGIDLPAALARIGVN
jgi:putative hydrolase of the HAD superfamily